MAENHDHQNNGDPGNDKVEKEAQVEFPGRGSGIRRKLKKLTQDPHIRRLLQNVPAETFNIIRGFAGPGVSVKEAIGAGTGILENDPVDVVLYPNTLEGQGPVIPVVNQDADGRCPGGLGQVYFRIVNIFIHGLEPHDFTGKHLLPISQEAVVAPMVFRNIQLYNSKLQALVIVQGEFRHSTHFFPGPGQFLGPEVPIQDKIRNEVAPVILDPQVKEVFPGITVDPPVQVKLFIRVLPLDQDISGGIPTGRKGSISRRRKTDEIKNQQAKDFSHTGLPPILSPASDRYRR
jgi:hypothetical protein